MRKVTLRPLYTAKMPSKILREPIPAARGASTDRSLLGPVTPVFVSTPFAAIEQDSKHEVSGQQADERSLGIYEADRNTLNLKRSQQSLSQEGDGALFGGPRRRPVLLLICRVRVLLWADLTGLVSKVR